MHLGRQTLSLAGGRLLQVGERRGVPRLPFLLAVLPLLEHRVLPDHGITFQSDLHVQDV